MDSFLKKKIDKKEALLSLFILIYLEKMNDEKWVKFANLIEPIDLKYQDFFKKFFFKNRTRKEKKWIQIFFSKSPLSFRNLFKKFIFSQKKDR